MRHRGVIVTIMLCAALAHADAPWSREDFAAALRKEIAAQGGPAMRYDPREDTLSAEGKSTINLTTLYAEAVKVAPAARAAHVARLARIALQQASTEIALEQLLPVVRERLYFDSTRLQSGEADMAVRHEPLGELLGVAPALDTPETVMPINESQLRSSKLGFAALLARAVKNLDARSPGDRFVKLAPGVYAATWGDEYDGSRLLLTGRIAKLGLRVPVALVGGRGHLFLVDGADEQALLAGATLVENARKEPRAVHGEALRLEGAAWVPFLPEKGAARERFLRLALEARIASYEEQRKLLEKRAGDVYVGELTAIQPRDGDAFAFASWSEGVPTWLPRADRVFFARFRAGQVEPIGWAPWDRVVSVMKLKPDENAPPRYRVTRFPTAAELAALKLEPLSAK